MAYIPVQLTMKITDTWRSFYNMQTIYYNLKNRKPGAKCNLAIKMIAQHTASSMKWIASKHVVDTKFPASYMLAHFFQPCSVILFASNANANQSVQFIFFVVTQREAPADGEGANIDRRLVPYHAKCMRIQYRIEFIYIYLYASTTVLMRYG